ncbi:MAG TPA: hypothetical protein VHW23_36245 [Kofleriaceae bacterium]|jgi:hypothetical protein|nr:hypothetical protein [Kofleriaceae bacterium]
MIEADVSLESIRALCTAREVDLVLAPPPAPYVVSWRAQFSDHGHFFSILVQDVEYLDMPGGLTVGDLRLTTDVDAVAAMTPRWSFLRGLYSGPMLVIRTADADDWPGARPQDLSLVVANTIVFQAGPDWEIVSPRRAGSR